MKTFSKILSIALVLVLALSAFVLPASAIDVDVQGEVTATPYSKDAEGNQIYKIDAWIDSTFSLYALQLWITWDDSAFQLMRNNATADATAINARFILDQDDPEVVFNSTLTAYEEWGGLYEGEYCAPGYGYAMFPCDSASGATVARITDGSLGEELLAEGYTGISWVWQADSSDNYLLISGGDSSGMTSPLSGKVKVASFYLREKATATPGTYEIGFNAKQVDRIKGTYATGDEIDSLGVGPTLQDLASVVPSMVSAYNNASVTIGAAGPVVSRSNAQVKMTRISDTEVADEFSFRVISTISDADWDAYFGNTAEGGNTNAIQKLGFVAYKGTDGFDMDTAKSAAQTAAVDEQATLPEGYFVAWTDYVQKVDDNSDAYFGARIDTTEQTCSDVTYIGVVQYRDANEETAYAFYETAEQTLLKTNYDKIVEYYLEQTK